MQQQTDDAVQMGDAAVWGEAAVVRLEMIFRQAAGSYIVENAHRINRGQMPVLTQSAADGEAAVDFFLFRTEEPERATELCVELVQERIPRRFGIAAQEIQVLSPMHRGAAGVGALNEALQGALNPPRPDRAERAMGSRILRVGDRVMQVRNNYDKGVFNGDLGYIESVDGVEQRLSVEFDRRQVPYDFLDLDELVHAYAISVHKSQGSEFPAVVIPVLTGHYMMLRRNLLYTAVTRARRLVVLVGQPKAIGIAVGNERSPALQRPDRAYAPELGKGDLCMNSNEKPLVAVQLYSLRHLSDSFDEIAATAAQAGYKGVELIPLPDHSGLEAKAVLEEHELQPVSAHVLYEALAEEFAATVEFQGCGRQRPSDLTGAGAGGAGGGEQRGVAGFRAHAQRAGPALPRGGRPPGLSQPRLRDGSLRRRARDRLAAGERRPGKPVLGTGPGLDQRRRRGPAGDDREVRGALSAHSCQGPGASGRERGPDGPCRRRATVRWTGKALLPACRAGPA